jgi:hypothetical protein
VRVAGTGDAAAAKAGITGKSPTGGSIPGVDCCVGP